MPRMSAYSLLNRVAICAGLLSALLSAQTIAQDQRRLAATARPNMVGAYGLWLSEKVLGDGPARLSFRTGKWKSLDEWRAPARERVWDCMAPIDLGGKPEVRVDATSEFDGLHIERLSWQLPGGPRTEAIFMKPAGAKWPLPGILALHDHGGNKFLGCRKIARVDDKTWDVAATHQEQYYGGAAWANEIAKRGYAVLIHDTFPFASRRVRVDEVSERVRQNGIDPEPDDAEGIKLYNAFAAAHEHIMEKSLLSAGTTWPGFMSSRTRKHSTCCALGRMWTPAALVAPACQAEGCGRCFSEGWTIASAALSPSGT